VGKRALRRLRALAALYYRNALEHPWTARAHADAERLREEAQRLCAIAAYRLRRSPKAQLAAVAALAFVSGGIGYSMLGAVRPQPPAAAVDSPPQAAATNISYASANEVERAQKSDRLLLAVSPADLLSLYERKGSDAVEVYKDGWVRLDYPIVSFGKQTFGKITYDMVEATAHFHSAFPGTVIAFFDEDRWDAQLRRRKPHDRLVAYCQFAAIDRVPFLANIDRLWFYGTSCELPLY